MKRSLACGGIFGRTASEAENGVPLLRKIPVLGFFFRHHSEIENRQELLIFITPRILNRQAMAQLGQLGGVQDG